MTGSAFEKVNVKDYNGMQFMDLVVSTSPVKHQWALSVNDKQIIERPLTLQLHKNSYKYDRELLLSSWSLQYPMRRVRGVSDSQYWRTEMILASLTDFKKVREWRDFFFDVANSLDCVLKGIIR